MLRRLTALHRWIGLVIGLQVIAWSAGGVYFAFNDIEVVRGDALRKKGPAPALELSGTSVPVGSFQSLRMVRRGEGLAWEVGLLDGGVSFLDASSHAELPPLTESEARGVVSRDLLSTAAVVGTARIDADPPLEYREKPLPAWRIDLADGAGTRVYVDARSGAIAAIRNDAWRRWDFLWGLHIMDYGGRDDMHHPLLLGAAVLALLAAATGLLLWASRLVARFRKRRRVS